MIKKIIAAVILVPLFSGAIIYLIITSKTMDFESVCDKENKKYTPLCENVGKRAVSQSSVININDKDYGEILGVSWRKKGSVISSAGQKQKRVSEKNQYFYIIGSDKKGEPQFLRAVGETDVR